MKKNNHGVPYDFCTVLELSSSHNNKKIKLVVSLNIKMYSIKRSTFNLSTADSARISCQLFFPNKERLTLAFSDTVGSGQCLLVQGFFSNKYANVAHNQ